MNEQATNQATVYTCLTLICGYTPMCLWGDFALAAYLSSLLVLSPLIFVYFLWYVKKCRQTP